MVTNTINIYKVILDCANSNNEYGFLSFEWLNEYDLQRKFFLSWYFLSVPIVVIILLWNLIIKWLVLCPWLWSFILTVEPTIKGRISNFFFIIASLYSLTVLHSHEFKCKPFVLTFWLCFICFFLCNLKCIFW